MSVAVLELVECKLSFLYYIGSSDVICDSLVYVQLKVTATIYRWNLANSSQSLGVSVE